jgi:hypothetical protein
MVLILFTYVKIRYYLTLKMYLFLSNFNTLTFRTKYYPLKLKKSASDICILLIRFIKIDVFIGLKGIDPNDFLMLGWRS